MLNGLDGGPKYMISSRREADVAIKPKSGPRPGRDCSVTTQTWCETEDGAKLPAMFRLDKGNSLMKNQRWDLVVTTCSD